MPLTQDQMNAMDQAAGLKPAAAAPALDPVKMAAMDAATGLQPTLGQKISSDFSKDQAETQAIRNQPTSVPQVVQMVGQGGKIVSDVAGDAINAAIPDSVKSVLGSVMNTVGKIVPDSYRKAVENTGAAVAQQYNKLPQPVQDVASGLGNTVKGLATIVPAADVVGGVAKAAPAIADAAKGVGTMVANGTPGVLGAAGDVLVNSGQNAATAARQSFVKDLVSPLNDTKTAKIDAVNNTDVSATTQKATIQPTKDEIESANNVAQIPDVSPSNTTQANFNAIKDANIKEAQGLKKQLDATGVNYMVKPTQEATMYSGSPDAVNSFHSVLNDAVNAIPSDATLTGNAQKTAQALADKMHEFVEANPPTPAGLLTARQQFDSFIESQKKNAFTDEMRGAFQVAKDVVRRTANSYVAQTAPGVPVAASLAKQSSLYRAMENIAPKAATEAPTMLGRTMQRLDNAIPVQNAIGKGVAKAALLSGAVAAPIVLPATTAAAGAAYGLGKAVMSPTTRIIAGKTLQEISKMSPSAAKAYFASRGK